MKIAEVKVRREAMIAAIRRANQWPVRLTLRARLYRLEAFHQAHPEYPIRTLCAATGINDSTFCNHLYHGKHGATVHAARRAKLKPQIHALAHELGEPNPRRIADRLRANGIPCTATLVRKILFNEPLANDREIESDERLLKKLTASCTRCVVNNILRNAIKSYTVDYRFECQYNCLKSDCIVQ